MSLSEHACIAAMCCQDRTRRVGVGQTLDVYRMWKPEIDLIISRRAKVRGLRMVGVLTGFAFALPVLGKPGEQWFADFNAGNLCLPAPLAILRELVMSDEGRLLERGAGRGVIEATLQALFLAHHKLDKGLAVVTEGANWFRAQQAAPVARVVKLFELKPHTPKADE